MTRPLILFGPADRHNIGDLLFPHIAAAMLPGRELIHAGLAARDLRADGGHAVRALGEVRTALGEQAADLLHVGGEILTCTAWHAAVMLLPAREVQATVAYLQDRPAERAAWLQRMLGTAAQAPYLVDRGDWPALRRVCYAGVGGVALEACDAAHRAEVLARLRQADAVAVRDVRTQAQLQAAGIAAPLLPDPAVMVAELFGPQLRQHAQQGEVAQLLRAFPQGYLALQCSAEFGDDATLTQLAQQLAALTAGTGLGVVLFRAGGAPWHDDLDVLRRLAARLPAGTVQVFQSLHLWDICALIAHSRGCCGSSLHGRIVAMACALPRLSLCSPVASTQSGKTAAFAATWEEADVPAAVVVAELAPAMLRALALPAPRLRGTAQRLARVYRQGFEALWTAPARAP